MIAPKNLKLNRFVPCRIPKASELFTRMGNSVNVPKAGYSGDEFVGILDGRKTDIDFSLLEQTAEETT